MMLALLLYVMLFRSLKLYAKKFCLKRQCTLYQIKICCPKIFFVLSTVRHNSDFKIMASNDLIDLK